MGATLAWHESTSVSLPERIVMFAVFMPGVAYTWSNTYSGRLKFGGEEVDNPSEPDHVNEYRSVTASCRSPPVADARHVTFIPVTYGTQEPPNEFSLEA